jgi:hypothetical protein
MLMLQPGSTNMETQTSGIASINSIHLPSSVKDAVATKAKLIWDTLSTINVNEHVEKKNGFSYLSWAWAWGVLMDNFPNSKFSFDQFGDGGGEVFYYPDGTAEVRCALSVDGVMRVMWLPVMDHRNKPIPKPDARAVNDTKMRCLVKAMALFGLGHYIYAGEDLPDASKSEPTKDVPAFDPSAPEVELPYDPVVELRAAMQASKGLAELKSSFTKASKYANNRNDKEMLQTFTLLKDELKVKLA